MIIDGKLIAEQVFEKTQKRVEALSLKPILAIITCNPNFETLRYLAIKQKMAARVGIETKVYELDDSNVTEDFILAIQDAVCISNGIIVQLPLPEKFDTKVILESIPPSHDADVLNPNTRTLLSPVVGSIKEILETHHVERKGKFVTIIGSGRLVGLPSYNWFIQEESHVSVVTKDTKDISYYTKNADIVVCGAGAPGLLTPDMVKDGVIILDAGTSEEEGELRGDCVPACADKASLFTPVPGGIGPITIAVLLSNVVDCAEAQKR